MIVTLSPLAALTGSANIVPNITATASKSAVILVKFLLVKMFFILKIPFLVKNKAKSVDSAC